MEEPMRLRFTRRSRRHKIGGKHVRYVLATATPEIVPEGGDDGDDAIRWIGPDDRGVELEVIGIVLPEEYLIIHVMPTVLRKGRQ